MRPHPRACVARSLLCLVSWSLHSQIKAPGRGAPRSHSGWPTCPRRSCCGTVTVFPCHLQRGSCCLILSVFLTPTTASPETLVTRRHLLPSLFCWLKGHMFKTLTHMVTTRIKPICRKSPNSAGLSLCGAAAEGAAVNAAPTS